MISLAVVAEVLIWVEMILTGARFLPYMLLSNWAMVFFMGLYLGPRPEGWPDAAGRRWAGAIGYGLGLAVFVAAWALLAARQPMVGGPDARGPVAFPFVKFRLGTR